MSPDSYTSRYASDSALTEEPTIVKKGEEGWWTAREETDQMKDYVFGR